MKVIDFHCDTLAEHRYAYKKGTPLDFGGSFLHIDLEKMKKGDYMLQCMAAFINLGRREENAFLTALEEIEELEKIIRQYPDDIRKVTTFKEIEDNRRAGIISALLTIEEGGCCLGNIEHLRLLYKLGVRIMTLTWNFDNELGAPNVYPHTQEELDRFLTSGDQQWSNNGACTVDRSIIEAELKSRTVEDILRYGIANPKGLTEAGREFVAEMERLGIIIDVSHLSDGGFWDVVNATKRPFIASHSNARALCGHRRNLTDEMIRAIGERGGLTGINYCAAFLDPEMDESKAQSTVSLMADHISYIANVGGMDMIGLGSDFDGIERNLEMYDCSCLPMLEAELSKRGFKGSDIEKIYHGNALRILKEFI